MILLEPVGLGSRNVAGSTWARLDVLICLCD